MTEEELEIPENPNSNYSCEIYSDCEWSAKIVTKLDLLSRLQESNQHTEIYKAGKKFFAGRICDFKSRKVLCEHINKKTHIVFPAPEISPSIPIDPPTVSKSPNYINHSHCREVMMIWQHTYVEVFCSIYQITI